MAETNILPLAPDYVLVTRWTDGVLRQQAESGRRFQRLKRPPQRAFDLEFRARSTAERSTLLRWWRRFEKSFFIFEHIVHSLRADGSGNYLPRFFAVTFAAPPDTELVANEAYDIRLRLLEAVGQPLNSYPDPVAGHESVFLEEAEGAVLAGTWTNAAQALAHGGSESTNPNSNATDAFQWTYAGYGLRLWARRDTNLGIADVLLDGVSLGTVDLYSAATSASQPVLTKLDLPLGLHTLKLQATNTKNAASSGNTIIADALEILI